MATLEPQPPLFLAAKNGNLKEVERLLAQPGVDVDECTKCGNTPLNVACYRGHKDIVMLLLNKGADPKKTNKAGITPLHLACVRGNADTVCLLLKHELDVNAQTTKVSVSHSNCNL